MIQVDPPVRHYEVAALKRGLSILDCFFSSPEEPLSATQIAREVGIHRATVFRFLSTLEASGYIEQTGRAGNYRLGSKWRLGQFDSPWPAAISLNSVPILKELSTETGETSEVGILYRGEVMFVQVVEGPQSVRVRQKVGDKYPAHLTSMGKVLLAYLGDEELARWLATHPLNVMTPNSIDSPQRLRAELSEIRRCGYAVDQQEYELGLACLAAPVKDVTGKAIAGVNISGPSSRLTYHRMPELATVVQKAAESLAAALSAGPH